ncbi:MAG: biotin/lipoyl-binding protein [Candidatus Azambacteria bacterium]|nr:biotin/lipoyl-binding protein [Candidatus Azambacteria bacterium]
MTRYYKISLLLLCVALIASILYFVVFPVKETITLVRQNIQEEVTGDGVVSAAGEVNIGFTGGGRVAEIYIKEGDTVKKDDSLIRLDVTEKDVERAQYEAKIVVEKLKLSQLLSGAEKKEIVLAEVKISTTAAMLENVRKELEDAKLQGESMLAGKYALAVDYGDTVLLNAENAARALLGIYNEQNKFKDIFIIEDSQKKSEAEWQIMLERTALENIKFASASLKKGLPRDDIDNTLSNLKTNLEVIRAALQKTSEVLSSATMIFGAPDIAGYRTTVAVQRSVINTTQTAILTLEQAIASQKSNGATAVRASENKVVEIENTIRTLEHELAIKKAFTTNAAIALGQAQIKEYESDLEAIQRQITDSMLRAPFDSVVRRMYVRRGGVVVRDEPVVVLAPLSDLQVDVVVTEADGKKIAVGDAADIMRHEGKNSGRVVDVRDNIITVHFENEESAPTLGTRVVVRIHTALKNGALFVPRGFIEEENDIPYVYVREAGKEKKTVVFTGMEWNGAVEIISGVSEGDVLVRP